MDTVFPMGLPGPTAFYVALYVLTFALHQALMHYVLAGGLYVAGTTMLPNSSPTPPGRQPLAAVLRDWMPFVLSAAITAGVAPLLFVQILYQQQFYTANILLSWRWMVVIPVLVVAFYLLYLIKSKLITRWPWLVRTSITTIAAVCFVFVGFCWTANYLLSISQSQWPDVYATGQLPLAASQVLLRMLVWCGGAFASMAVILGWQLSGPVEFDHNHAATSRTLAIVAVAGIAVALVGGIATLWRLDESTRSLVTGPAGWPYLLAAAVGLVVQVVGWLLQWQRGSLGRALLAIVSLGWVASLVSISAVREIGRVATLDMADLYARHAGAREISGLALFLVFAVVNFAIIAGCVWIVRRRGR